MYQPTLHSLINAIINKTTLDIAGVDNAFYARLLTNSVFISQLYEQLYSQHPLQTTSFEALLKVIVTTYENRSVALKQRDYKKMEEGSWYCSQQLTGMSLYVDRFAGKLPDVTQKLDYFSDLGVNVLHLMPLFESPMGESDGGYAVSDFRKVDEKLGSIADLQQLQQTMLSKGMYLMLDIVLNHTSYQHIWARNAAAGIKKYQDFYYTYTERKIPDACEQTMPEVFPESAPGSFTWNESMQRWVMTVFHQYQWDLNFSNPEVLVAMLDNIFFLANIGVDILRIDAPAFIWKKMGTTCQNLPEAHQLLRLLRLCTEIAAPGMALLAEAIVAPAQIMEYFGKGSFTARECHFAYNATHMALQWDALATGDTRIMLAAQHELLKKPKGASWITYTRCHDDIGLGYDDYMIRQAGYDPYEHRRYLKDYFSGNYPNSPARGALFGYNPKTQDARISGTLASLCGLETAIEQQNQNEITLSIQKILLMQAHALFLGGLPMLFYGDELGYTNDYSYLNDTTKSYDNRWMHRPLISDVFMETRKAPNSPQQLIFEGTKKLIAIRQSLPVLADNSNLEWMRPHNLHVAGYIREKQGEKIFCLFNFSQQPAWLTWYAFKENGLRSYNLRDLWSGNQFAVGRDDEYLVLQPYSFAIFMVE